MPFHNGAYYPYSSLTQGTHSSDGIPSVLNSPISHAASAPSMTPSSGASTFLPFKFRPRRESVDWRRINAVDIDLVMSQLDVDALQEHISAVTFCSLEGERCQRCQSPVDPALVKLLQLAQLTVEWLLHCQDLLSLNLRAAEERLVAAGMEQEQLQAQSRKQEEKIKELTAELKHRRKVIRTQQSLFAPRITSSHKCPHCEKYFLNSSFLQNHLQRRHPDEFQTQLQSDGEKKSQMENLKQEISSLKQQVVQQQQDLQAKIAEEKEQQHLYRELQRELDRFKSEEMARMDRMIEDSRDGMRREIKFLCKQNFQALNEVSQTSRMEKTPSPVAPQPERDVERYEEMHLQAIQKLELQMKKQDKKWEFKLQDMKTEHESEKNQLLNELSRVQSLVKQEQELSRKLQEKEQTIRAQREQIRTFSSNPPIKVVEVPVATETPAPKPKPKRVVLEEPVSALKLDPIQELSDEEKDSCSISEKKLVVNKAEPAPAKKPKLKTRKRSPDIKEIRPALELSLTQKLEGLGVRGDQSGLKNKELMSLLAELSSNRDAAVKGLPGYWRCREEIVSVADEKLRARWRGNQPAPEPQSRSKQPVQVMQIRPRSSSLPSRSSQVTSSGVKHQKVPQPAPRTKTSIQPKTSTPNTKTAVQIVSSKTPPFSSDEESEEESDSEEEPSLKSKSPMSRLFQGTPVQIKASRTGPVQTRSAATSQNFSSKQPTGAAFHTAVTKMESEEEEDDWSDVSELQEIDPKQTHSFKEQNGNMNKSFDKGEIRDLARKMEQQFAARAVKRPAGGVSVLPERKDEVQELLIIDVEDGQEVTKPASLRGSGPLRKSLDSPSTSVWGTSTGKAASSGVTEAGTGSTLKSSLCSLSDISDSEY